MEKINVEKIISQIKQTIEEMNLKDKWSTFKLKLDQIPIPKWMLVIITSVSVVVAIASFASKSHNNNVENQRFAHTDDYDADKYDTMLEEYASKSYRLIGLIEDMRMNSHDAFAPFEYANKIEKLAKEVEKLALKLQNAPLNSRQKLYKDEIEADLEDAMRWFKYN
jgi:hypothetical protein